MSAQMVVELPDGHKIFVGGSTPPRGLSEVSVGKKAAVVAADRFKAALTSLAGLVKAMEETVGDLPKKPDEVTMEFRASLTGECDLWIVSGETEAEFKVTLTWGKK